jgi:hypothetical protein
MECREFIDSLERLLAERLTGEARRAALEHAAECASCSERFMAAEGTDFDLAGSVLRLTSGPACGSARPLLCDEIDGEIEQVDSELVRMHVDGCAECAALLEALAALDGDLPLMAEMAPDERFVDEVLDKTLQVRSPAGRWADRLALAVRQMVRRPRFAMEGAYVGTLLLLLVFGAQSTLLAEIPRKALELADAAPITELKGSVTSRASSAWKNAVGEIARLSSEKADTLKQKIGTIRDSLASEQETDKEQETDDERQ